MIGGYSSATYKALLIASATGGTTTEATETQYEVAYFDEGQMPEEQEFYCPGCGILLSIGHSPVQALCRDCRPHWRRHRVERPRGTRHRRPEVVRKIKPTRDDYRSRRGRAGAGRHARALRRRRMEIRRREAG